MLHSIYLTQRQRFILLQVHFFYLGSGSFHLAKAISNILSAGRFKSVNQFYAVRSVISSLVSSSLLDAFFNLSKEV